MRKPVGASVDSVVEWKSCVSETGTRGTEMASTWLSARRVRGSDPLRGRHDEYRIEYEGSDTEAWKKERGEEK